VAEQVVIKVWCDVCQTDTDTKTEGGPFNVNGLRVDLCPEHARPVVDVLEMVKSYGRKPQKVPDKAPAPTIYRTPEKAPAAPDLPPRVCPDCGRTFRGGQGVSSHRRLVHGYRKAPA
jgi:hypothetical protein